MDDVLRGGRGKKGKRREEEEVSSTSLGLRADRGKVWSRSWSLLIPRYPFYEPNPEPSSKKK